MQISRPSPIEAERLRFSMATPSKKWRVRQTPQMSADMFAQFMAVGDTKRDEIAQQAKYQLKIPAGYHAVVRQTIKEFLNSKTRDWAIIEGACERLSAREASASLHPKTRERLRNNVGALRSFQNGYNRLGIGRFKLEDLHPKQPKLSIGKLRVSVSLDFLIRSVDNKGQDRIGGLMFAFTKRSEPKQVQSTARYERMAKHAASLIHMHLTDHFAELGSPVGKNCLWVDNHLQRTHAATGDYKTLLADMQRAGSRVADEWEAIQPPPGFDLDDADFGS